MLIEPFDPLTGAERLADKRVLLYEARHDSLVTNHATEMLVRSIGLPVTTPSTRLPFGLAESPGPVPAGFTVYDLGVPPPPAGNVSPDDNGVHGDVHNVPAVERQVLRFLDEQLVHHECRAAAAPAPCFCAEGNCQ
jgi:hypothetical protein